MSLTRSISDMCKSVHLMRIVAAFSVGLVAGSTVASESTITIGAWNLEHLNEEDGTGCLAREPSDYDAIRQRIQSYDLDVVAIQEVENAEAAYRVFPKDDWVVEMSARPSTGKGAECWDTPGKYLRHQGTGFAVRRNVDYVRNDDLSQLAVGNPGLRWGTDITVRTDPPIRLLSIHLRSGCWGTQQDNDEGRASICQSLREQMPHLQSWVDSRERDGHAYVVLGDFNRRLAVEGDWGYEVLAGSTESRPFLLTKPLRPACDPRYTELIDHIVTGQTLRKRFIAESLREIPKHADHPDHCLIFASFSLDAGI